MTFLTSVRVSARERDAARYPWNIPAIGTLHEIAFDTPVTFLVGENGTGKSTLLEGIGVGIESIAVGGEDLRIDPTLEEARNFAAHLVFSWRKKTRRGFFLRAEDFINYTRRTARLVRELAEFAESYEGQLSGYGLSLARAVALNERQALVERYGEDLNNRSHGESFLEFFQSRLVPEGLYLLDEPDTALSAQRQLALLGMLKDMVGQGAQFVIATHSPILMACPSATILSFDGPEVRKVTYDDVPQVTLTRDFLQDPRAFIRHL